MNYKRKKDPDLSLFDKLFKKQSTYEDKWSESERLYNGEFKEEDTRKRKKKKRSNIFIPVTRNTVNIIKGIFATAFFSKGNPIELLPLSEDEVEQVGDRNKILNHFYKKWNPAKELIQAFLSSLLYGMGVVLTFWDPDKKRVITRFIPISDIAFDNECTSIDDIECLAYRHYESVRTIKSKINKGYYNAQKPRKLLKALFGDEEHLGSKRFEIKVLYQREGEKWRVKTFINRILVKDVLFKRLPFQFGYAIAKLPSIDPEKRKDEILCYGENIPWMIKEIQEEINRKRNIKNDIHEKNLNPDVFVGDKAGVDPSNLNHGSGKKIPVEGDVNQIKERTAPQQYDLNADLAMLSGDINSAVGVNSIQAGETSSSDRRSMVALSTVNANSSMRIEEMIMLNKDTLFDHWAKIFVELVMLNADDETINKITGKENPIGKKGERDPFEYDIKINFGATLDKEKKIADILQALQMLSQNQQINPRVIEELLKRFLQLRIGDEINIEDIFNKEDLNAMGQMGEDPGLEAEKPPDPGAIEKENLKRGAI